MHHSAIKKAMISAVKKGLTGRDLEVNSLKTLYINLSIVAERKHNTNGYNTNEKPCSIF